MDLRLSVDWLNFKGNLSVLPLVLVLDKIEVVVQNKPGDFFVGKEFRDLKLAIVRFPVTVNELVTDLATFALIAPDPPPVHVQDR
jgi:hypothetical protein